MQTKTTKAPTVSAGGLTTGAAASLLARELGRPAITERVLASIMRGLPEPSRTRLVAGRRRWSAADLGIARTILEARVAQVVP